MCFEPATELGRRLDRLYRLKGPHAPPHRRVIAATGRTTREMTLETPQLSRGGDQPVAKVGIPVQELSTRHAAMLYRGKRRRVPPTYSSKGSISSATRLLALLRRLCPLSRS